VLVVIPCHVVFSLGQCRPSLLEHILHPVCELIHHFNSRWRLVWFKAHPRVMASEERHLLHGGVYMVIVCELCEWEERVPVVLSFPDEDT